MRLHVEPDRTFIRAAASSTRYVRVSFTAPESPRRGRRLPINISLVLDRSGSMSGGKFDLAREAAGQALAQLRADDRFSVVVYDEEVDLLLPSSAGTAQARARAAERLRAVEPRGTTDLCAGWLRGCEQVGLAVTEESVGRCLLLTDGLANQGVTDRNELLTHAGELRARGVATSTFGVGADFDEQLLQGMAEAGAGNFYFLKDARQIPDLLASEIGEALEVVARQAALVITLPDGVSAEQVGRRRVRREGGTVRVELDDLVSGQEVELIVALKFPTGRQGDRVEAVFTVEDRGGAIDSTEELVTWSFASHAENDRQARDVAVDRVVARFYAARARAEAVDRNRDGDLAGARRVLLTTARRIREYAGEDRELLDLARELERQSEEYSARVMEPVALKAAAFENFAALRARAPDGKARRRS